MRIGVCPSGRLQNTSNRSVGSTCASKSACLKTSKAAGLVIPGGERPWAPLNNTTFSRPCRELRVSLSGHLRRHDIRPASRRPSRTDVRGRRHRRRAERLGPPVDAERTSTCRHSASRRFAVFIVSVVADAGPQASRGTGRGGPAVAVRQGTARDGAIGAHRRPSFSTCFSQMVTAAERS
jgi:hypothetical protein